MVLKPLGDETGPVSCRFYGRRVKESVTPRRIFPNCLPLLVFPGVVFRLKVVGPEMFVLFYRPRYFIF